MTASHRVLLLCVVLLTTLSTTHAQPRVPAPEPTVDVLTLPTDTRAARYLEAAHDYLADRDWATAVDALQRLLDQENDVLVAVSVKGADGREVRRIVGARSEAHRLLATLPTEGRTYYQEKYGTAADVMHTAAKREKDVARLADVARRFPLTKSGAEALGDLATLAFDAGHFHLAAAYHQKLLDVRPIEKWSDAALFEAAVVFRRTDNVASAGVEKELLRRAAGDGVSIADKRLGANELKEELAKRGKSTPTSNWTMFDGDPPRSGVRPGGAPVLEREWSVPHADLPIVARWMEQAIEHFKQRNDAMLAANSPLGMRVKSENKEVSLVLFRNDSGVQAHDLSSGKLHWKAALDGGLGRMLSTPQTINSINQWLGMYVTQRMRPGLLFENSVVGTLSSDGQQVYLVNDLDLPAPPRSVTAFNPMELALPLEIRERLDQNSLYAFSAASGKLLWTTEPRANGDPRLAESIFLGPPLPVDGRLFALNEKKQELRLVVLDAAKGKVLGVHVIGVPREPVTNEPVRRTQAAHLAYGEGVVVCPTNSGAIVGVDALSGALLWVHVYDRQEAPPPNPIARPFPRPAIDVPGNDLWKVSAPVVRGGKIVFASPDSRSLRCLNLRDGTLVWFERRRDEDLYFAGVHGDKALIVGKKTVRGVNLDKGEVVWTLETGLPSGRGALAEGGHYYLPLAKSAKDGGPAVAVLDVNKGTIISLVRSRKGEVPGNLVFFDGKVLSQSATELAVYPQLQKKLEEIDELLKKNPKDPTGLTERGVLKLDKGDLQGAVDDLRAALANEPSKSVRLRAREKLYDTLTEYLRRDFNAAEKYLKEYEELLKPEKEEETAEYRRRRTQYLVLLGLGREGQGKAVEALQAYLALAAIPGGELLATPEEPGLRVVPAVWARARVAAVVAKYGDKQRKAIDAEIAGRFTAAREAKDFETLRSLADLFDEVPAGREARFEVVQFLINERNYLEADRHLQRLRRSANRETAGRAVEGLARLHTQQGTLTEAMHYYRVLARDFGKVAVRDGKTGQALFDDLVTDKRFMPFLKEPERFPETKLKVQSLGANVPAETPYELRHVGEALPFFDAHTFFLSTARGTITMSAANRNPVWTQQLSRTIFPNMAFYSQPGFSYAFANLGHVVYLPIGQKLFAIDPLGKRILWERDLHTHGPPGAEPMFTLGMADPRDGGMQIAYQEGWVQRAGSLPVIGTSTVCVNTRHGLLGLHPTSGEVLWQRTGVANRSHVWGDDQFVCVVETQADGTAAGMTIHRLVDGTTVNAPAFAAAYERRLRLLGRSILVAEPPGQDGTRLHLYDSAIGKDVWTKTVPAGARLLSTLDPDLTGFVERDGKVLVLDARTGKDRLRAEMDPRHLEKVAKVQVFADEKNVYVGCDNLPNAEFAGHFNAVNTGTGLRSILLDGELYAFDAATGKEMWRQKIPGQYLIVDPTGALPVLLFAARETRMGGIGGRPQQMQVGTVRVLAKATGKVLFESETLPATNAFYGLSVDVAKRRAELSGTQVRIVVMVEEEK